jgi:short chain dehydrogenase
MCMMEMLLLAVALCVCSCYAMTAPLPAVAAQTATVVVTGASRGLGRQLALQAAQLGHPVVGLARPSADLTSLATEVHFVVAVPLCSHLIVCMAGA